MSQRRASVQALSLEKISRSKSRSKKIYPPLRDSVGGIQEPEVV